MRVQKQIFAITRSAFCHASHKTTRPKWRKFWLLDKKCIRIRLAGTKWNTDVKRFREIYLK
jgi:hypothetical protein